MPRNSRLSGSQPLTSTLARFLSSKATVSTSDGATSATPSICRRRSTRRTSRLLESWLLLPAWTTIRSIFFDW